MIRLYYLFLLLAIFLLSCQSENTKSKEKPATTETKATQDTTTISKNPNKNLYWGDTHLHTNLSPDAFANGTRLSPDLAYRFAKGEEVTATSGIPVRLSRPLDFLVIADHAEGLGLANEILAGNPAFMKDTVMVRWRKMFQKGGEASIKAGTEMPEALAKGLLSKEVTSPKVLGPIAMKVWRNYLQVAENHNQPGTFTSLIGYEWSSMPSGNNIHRVVVYRDGIDKAAQTLPYSAFQSPDPADLWKALTAYENKTGGKVLAIPHNGNLSNGRMFPLSDFNQNPMTKEYASLRARWEPLVETTQFKGDSEAHATLSPNDEFAAYGDWGWDMGNMTLSEEKTDDMLAGDYSREALKNGLMLEETVGANPYKFGLIGSTDSHTGLATADEDNWLGKFTHQENNSQRAVGQRHEGRRLKDGRHRWDWHYLSSGYAAVWAESNTREDLWDAMKRKEVYGTTGPRIQLRFFGGWNFQTEDVKKADYVNYAYQNGVPMGGDLTNAPQGKKPTFVLVAAKDPEGAHLDRIQIIKGWVKDGKTYEEVINVAWSGDRQVDKDGNIPPVGNTVDATTATWTNDIGAAELATVWMDEDFDPTQNAFYYVRVLEIPTPRWTTYDAVKHGLDLPKNTPLSIQERAYSSPIWYVK